MNSLERVCAIPARTVKMNPKREVRSPKYKMRVVGAGRGKGSFKRPKSNNQQWSKGE